jgi:phage terminase large subunit-like protein
VSLDAALGVFLSLRRDTGARIGEDITADQLADARNVLDPESAMPYSWLGRARGYAKTDDVAGFVLAVMLTQLPRRARAYGFAADREQAQLLVDAAAGFVERTEEVRGAFVLDAWRVTAHGSGASFGVLASDAASTWGLRPAFAVIDELANFEATGRPQRVWDAVTSALGKMPGARLVTITSAGDPASWQYQLREHALADPLWYVHEIPGPPPWIDAARLDEQRRRLMPSMFSRLFDNIWTEGEDRLTTVADVRAAVGHDGDLAWDHRNRYCVALDVGIVNDRTAAIVAHGERRVGGLTVVVDRLAVWDGTRTRPVDLTAVEAWVENACRDYRAPLIFDAYQAAHLTQRLKTRGVRVQAFTFSSGSVARLATTLFNLLRDHRLDLPADDQLISEIASVRLRETSPGVVRMDHAPGAHDDQAIALSMAAAHVVDNTRRPSGASMRLVRAGPISR